MNSHTLRVLEYEQIRALLAEQISTDLGRERVAEMAPLDEEEDIRRLLQETGEARRIMDVAGSLPLGGIHDVRASVEAAAREGLIEASALLDLADTVSSARRLRGFLLKRAEDAPRLAALGREIGDFERLEEEIRRCISPRGDVLDEASASLARVRKEQKVAHGRMMERLHSFLRNSAYRDMIQDPVVTVRDDRYCIPVKAEYRSQFGGLVHDQSASGATVFMEPAAVVELGNELRQLAIKERQEIERILRELASKVGREAIPLTGTLHTLSLIDFISAKAKLAFAMEATEPKLNREGLVELWKARHPLLKGEVVPIDVRLGGEFTQLVITGPNTGGKTVTLKTVGLLALMAQSGLHIPANDGSTLPVFRGIYADIGDEQSIQQSLSTFSGHITNIARILKAVEITGRRSLVLLDEVGAGTDPTEGSALAKAILRHLWKKGVRTIGTTHYGELKEFAYSHEGVENASVEFDMETLRPTYRLLIGIPGSSNAFAIAARLGLPDEVIQAAHGMLSDEENTITEVIQKLTADQKATELDLARAASAAREVDELRQKYDRELRQLQADRRQTLERARADAFEIIRNAKRQADQLLDELKRQEKERRKQSDTFDPQQARQEIQRLARKLSESLPGPEAGQSETTEAPRAAAEPQELVVADGAPRAGDPVLVSPFNQRGTLLSEPEGGKAQVQIGAMRMTVPYANLRRVVEARQPAMATALTQRRMQMRQTLSPEIMLLGMRAEQAMEALDAYMDNACMAGISPVRVVHGKGTGALKKVVWDYLQGHPHVGSFRLGEDGEGGGGVTVVQLKEQAAMLEQAVRAAASPLHVPGQVEWQVISPAQVEAIAAEHTLPRWQVEVAALEAEIVPLHYMRNLARFAMRGQLDLLRSAVTVVGSGLPVQKCLQILAAHGIGRLRVLVPVQGLGVGSPALGTASGSRDKSSAAGVSRLTSPELLAGVVANQNASLQTSADTIDLRRGDPSALLGEPDFPADGWVVAACLEDAAEEMLLQVACKRRGVPLILGALQEDVGQATTILPGDPGVPLIYQADHPHLDRTRPGSLKQDGYQGMIVGTWLADQVIALRLGLGEVLQNRLLYADMGSGEMQTFPLGRSGAG